MPGAHNSLLEVQHSQTGQMAETSSTGEQKSLVISVILAHARLQNQRLSRPPVLLLDDIVSHLDAERRLALFELTAALPGQVWFSGTDSISFAPISRDANVIHLDKGQVV
jgi:DNA replication and repair protein RecF